MDFFRPVHFTMIPKKLYFCICRFSGASLVWIFRLKIYYLYSQPAVWLLFTNCPWQSWGVRCWASVTEQQKCDITAEARSVTEQQKCDRSVKIEKCTAVEHKHANSTNIQYWRNGTSFCSMKDEFYSKNYFQRKADQQCNARSCKHDCKLQIAVQCLTNVL